MGPTVLQFGMPGTQEMMIILLIAVLLFGANKIPKLARSTGQAMGEFQKGREEVEKELEEIKNTGDEIKESATPDTSFDEGTDSSADTESTAETSTETAEE